MGTIYPCSDPETPFSTKYLATRGPKMRLGTRKCIGVKRLTHIKINARNEINWANSFFKNFWKPFFGQIFGHQRAENEARNKKMYRVWETHPIRVNARYEMNWANSFFKKFQKHCQTSLENLISVAMTDGQTNIWVNPVYPHSTLDGAGV